MIALTWLRVLLGRRRARLLATAVGVGVSLVHLDPIRALFVASVINGIVAPPLLFLIVLLGADSQIMGQRVSSGLSLVLTWTAAGAMALAAAALLLTTLVSR